MNSFGNFIKHNSNEEIRKLARIAENNIIWSNYPDKNQARNICARIFNAEDENLNKLSGKNNENGLKK